jgi:hypothetical protein
MSVIPIAFYDFGFQSSIGLRFLWNNGFLTPGSKFSLKLGTGGVDWWRDGTIVVAVPETRGFRVGFDASARRRPDQQFFGIGARTPQTARARYLNARFAVGLSAGWRELSLHAVQASPPASCGAAPAWASRSPASRTNVSSSWGLPSAPSRSTRVRDQQLPTRARLLARLLLRSPHSVHR